MNPAKTWRAAGICLVVILAAALITLALEAARPGFEFDALRRVRGSGPAEADGGIETVGDTQVSHPDTRCTESRTLVELPPVDTVSRQSLEKLRKSGRDVGQWLKSALETRSKRRTAALEE